MEAELTRDLRSSLQSFEERHGRPLSVLHIGNIANNAYINAKLLIEAGVDCDVICYDYYHIMGCPEWEDADFDGEIKDQFFPNWRLVNLKGFRRPRWFVQGPLRFCIQYLVAKRDGKKLRAWFWWNILEIIRSEKGARGGRALLSLRASFRNRLTALRNQPEPVGRAIFYFLALIFSIGGFLFYSVISITVLPNRLAKKAQSLFDGTEIDAYGSKYSFDEHVLEFVEKWKQIYPDREDKFSKSDVEMYRHVIVLWRELFKRYDIIQAYATDPILPLLAGKRAYIAFEHGTLRDFTLCDSAVCRNTSLSYRLADHVFITNGDCLEYAKKIGVVRYSPMIHPLQIGRIRATLGDYDRVHQQRGTTYIFLCILRHDWKVKGTDQYIRALPKLKEILGSDFCLVMTKWGAQVEESKNLASELRVENLIHWIEPLNRLSLTRMLKSVDILFDQIALPHFGATAPEGIAAEVPVIMSYDPSSTAWLIPEPAPILSAWTIEDIVRCVQQAIDPSWREEYRKRARRWIDTYHDSNIIVKGHMQAYKEVLEIE